MNHNSLYHGSICSQRPRRNDIPGCVKHGLLGSHTRPCRFPGSIIRTARVAHRMGCNHLSEMGWRRNAFCDLVAISYMCSCRVHQFRTLNRSRLNATSRLCCSCKYNHVPRKLGTAYSSSVSILGSGLCMRQVLPIWSRFLY